MLVDDPAGCTNVLMKRGAKGGQSRDDVAEDVGIVQGLWNLVRNVWFMLPFALNQAGSLLFYVLLGYVQVLMEIFLDLALGV